MTLDRGERLETAVKKREKRVKNSTKEKKTLSWKGSVLKREKRKHDHSREMLHVRKGEPRK